MRGKFILFNRPSRFVRQNFLLALLWYAGIVFFVITLIISTIFFYLRQYDAAATIFVFSIGITGYIVNTAKNRQIQLNEITNCGKWGNPFRFVQLVGICTLYNYRDYCGIDMEATNITNKFQQTMRASERA